MTTFLSMLPLVIVSLFITFAGILIIHDAFWGKDEEEDNNQVSPTHKSS